MDLYQLSVVVSYCLLSEGLFKGTRLALDVFEMNRIKQITIATHECKRSQCNYYLWKGPFQ